MDYNTEREILVLLLLQVQRYFLNGQTTIVIEMFFHFLSVFQKWSYLSDFMGSRSHKHQIAGAFTSVLIVRLKRLKGIAVIYCHSFGALLR